ncbi:Sterile alpha motif domain-containing protein [Hirschfeldia incana]|nr:Sterile alpha motif domain-containing protein [Hirschfeldia incana]
MSPTQFVRKCAGCFSVISAADLGISSVMRGIRGKDDVTNRLVSGSGSGLVISFLTQGLKRQPAHALFCATGLAVMSGTAYQVVTSYNAQDAPYAEARAMLVKLGLEEYKKNFKKGHFTDPTLTLLTDSDLKDVGIPPGARRLILDHIKRSNEKVNGK